MNLADLPVVILAGGRGARFDHESQVSPKPLIEVAGRPIIEHIIGSFYCQGFREFVVAGGYFWDMLRIHFGAVRLGACRAVQVQSGWVFSRNDGSFITVLDTGLLSHTGERVSRVHDYLGDRPFVLTYGDGVSDVRMTDVLAEHIRDESVEPWHLAENGRYIPHPAHQSPLVTITAVNPPGRFGVLEFNGAYRTNVRRFWEKGCDDWINGGFMIVEPAFVDEYIGVPGRANELESVALPQLAEHWRLRAHRHRGYWRCMDTRRDLEQIEQDVANNGGHPPWMPYDGDNEET